MSLSDQDQPGRTAPQRLAGSGPGRTATAARQDGERSGSRTAEQPRVPSSESAAAQGTATQGTATQRQQARPAGGGGPAAPAAARTDKSRQADRSAGSARPAAAPHPVGPRRVRLTVSRVDPWSIMKLSFLLSVAIGIAMVVAAGVLWTVLDGMGVYADINRVVGEILADPSFDVNEFIGFSKVISLATVIAVVDVVLITAIATLGAFLYNLASALVGGLHVTLSDD